MFGAEPTRKESRARGLGYPTFCYRTTSPATPFGYRPEEMRYVLYMPSEGDLDFQRSAELCRELSSISTLDQERSEINRCSVHRPADPTQEGCMSSRCPSAGKRHDRDVIYGLLDFLVIV